MYIINKESIFALSEKDFSLVKAVNLLSYSEQDINFILEYVCERFINLEELIIIKSHLSKIPENIEKLNKLRRLWLCVNDITTLPNTINKLSNLEELELKKTKIIKLPKTFADLQNLKVVSFSKKMYENNNSIINNKNMIVINWNNKIIVPEYVTHLNIVNCHGANLNNLPPTVKHLIISGVDKPLFNLPSCLKTLNLQDTKNITISDIRLPFDCEYLGEKLSKNE